MTATYKLSELLKGCRLMTDDTGRVLVQTIRNMGLAFLTTDEQFSLDNQFANPMALDYENRNYGNLRIINPDARDAVSIPNVVVITKRAAQNHAMMKAGYIRGSGSVSYNDAACVEGSQGGYITKGDNIVRMLPMHLRPRALALTGQQEYSKFYPYIGDFGERLGVNTGSYIDPYFRKYDNELNQFIAHFERPPNTIGVVVLVNDEIIAIDKFPSFTYAAQVWDVLVRDCYGSVALEAMLKGWKAPNMVSETMFDGAEVLYDSPEEHLLDVIKTIKVSIGKVVESTLAALMSINFNASMESSGGSTFESYLLSDNDYIGQVITSGGFHYMVNISPKKIDFSPAAAAARRRFIEERLMASQQEPFKV